MHTPCKMGICAVVEGCGPEFSSWCLYLFVVSYRLSATLGCRAGSGLLTVCVCDTLCICGGKLLFEGVRAVDSVRAAYVHFLLTIRHYFVWLRCCA